ncbi:MAG: DNA polymerase III subunit delta' [Pseudomonadota bacterium]
MSDEEESKFPSPAGRVRQTGRESVEARIRSLMNEDAFTHGWIITGADGAGKATLAYRIARALLDPGSLTDGETLEASSDAKSFRQIAAGAHPDLFVAERAWDEKKSRYQTEISVETIRKVTSFMSKTAAGGGARVAIVDTADDMNRNAANALLKILEEPPSKTTLLLLSATPGKLLATIRSRCRRIDLRALDDDAVTGLLASENLADGDAASRIAAHAAGRPGYALRLAAGEGASAISLAHQFIGAARKKGDISKVTGALTGKNTDERWAIFCEALTGALADAARAVARGAGEAEGPLSGVDARAIVKGFEAMQALMQRGDALNLDRTQLLGAMAYDLQAALATQRR